MKKMIMDKQKIANELKNIYIEVDKHYNRELAMLPQRQVRLYTSMAVFMLFIFGGFGIRTQLGYISEKNDYSKRLIAHTKILKNRIKAIEELEKQLEEAKPYLETFDEIMPNNINFDDYLVEVVVKASEAGFIVQSMNQNEAKKGGIKVSVKFTGENDPKNIIKLVRNMGELDRVTQIQNLRVRITEEEINGTMALEIYRLEQKKLQNK